MRRYWVWALVALVGCSGVASSGLGEEEDDAGSDTYTPPSQDAGGEAQSDASRDDVKTSSDAGGDTSQSADVLNDVTSDVSVDSGHDVGAPDVGVDVNQPDVTPIVDSGPDTNEPPDAGEPDTGPPPECMAWQTRCHDFKYETCSSSKWAWQVGDQRCCNQPGRYTRNATTSVDTTTGLTWNNTGGSGSSRAGAQTHCEGLQSLASGRLPTTAELLQIVIGPPENNVSVCSPTVDQVAIVNVTAGNVWTSDGCVDLLRGLSKPACTNATGFLCVSN